MIWASEKVFESIGAIDPSPNSQSLMMLEILHDTSARQHFHPQVLNFLLSINIAISQRAKSTTVGQQWTLMFQFKFPKMVKCGESMWITVFRDTSSFQFPVCMDHFLPLKINMFRWSSRLDRHWRLNKTWGSSAGEVWLWSQQETVPKWEVCGYYRWIPQHVSMTWPRDRVISWKHCDD